MIAAKRCYYALYLSAFMPPETGDCDEGMCICLWSCTQWYKIYEPNCVQKYCQRRENRNFQYPLFGFVEYLELATTVFANLFMAFISGYITFKNCEFVNPFYFQMHLTNTIRPYFVYEKCIISITFDFAQKKTLHVANLILKNVLVKNFLQCVVHAYSVKCKTNYCGMKVIGKTPY